MIKLMMALVYLSGDVEYKELTGSEYSTIQDCQNHARQLSFTWAAYNRVWSDKYDQYMQIVAGGFYCEVSE